MSSGASRAFLLIAVCAACCLPCRAQTAVSWIWFTDKGPGAGRLLATADAALLGLTTDALARRATMLGLPFDAGASADDILAAARAAERRQLSPASGGGSIVDVADLPVWESYIAAVRGTGARIRAVSKWMNAVSAVCTPGQRSALARLPFVERIEPVRRWKRFPETPAAPAILPKAPAETRHGLEYGESATQLDVINVPRVHDIWIDGTGLVIGMLDNGFRWRMHEALERAHVRGEYDFINRDSLTANEAGDPADQDGHGTVTMSALAGLKEGMLVGPAFNAAMYLAKTEVNGSETAVEEDYWAEGIEWLESRGVSVASSSLGYSTWGDSTGYSWANGDFDGQTAVTTRAAARAARLGVVVVTAMGNEGNVPGTLIAPSDADSILSIGSITMDNIVSSFSSNGPTNDGRIKPDVVTPGSAVRCATTAGTSSYTRASGTSLATPLAAGVATLVRSARPELTPLEVREAMRSTADNASAPDNSRGWGKVDAWKALLYHGMVISTNPKVLWDGAENRVALYVVSPRVVARAQVTLRYTLNGSASDFSVCPAETFVQMDDMPEGSGLYIFRPGVLPRDALIRYYVTANDDREERSSPWGAPVQRHEFRVGETHMEGGRNIVPSTLRLAQGYPNPLVASLHNSIIIPYDIPEPGGAVRLDVHDQAGRVIATLVDADRSPASYVATLPAGTLRSGTYYCTLQFRDAVLMKHFLVLR